MPNETNTALVVAYRHFCDATTTDAEREAILRAMVEHFDGQEGETAAAILHHRDQARAQQMQLKGLLEGIR
ncbi:MAG TPA: hypothetical protein VGD88_06155 [Opitutaceae bacterium]